MDKQEEISDGKKEEAPAAENDATSVGGGKVAATAEARAADTRGEAVVRQRKLLPASGRM
jgi:hypothetical protein